MAAHARLKNVFCGEQDEKYHNRMRRLIYALLRRVAQSVRKLVSTFTWKQYRSICTCSSSFTQTAFFVCFAVDEIGILGYKLHCAVLPDEFSSLWILFQNEQWNEIRSHLITTCIKLDIWAASGQNQQNGMYAQRRLRSDQSLSWPHEESLGP